MKLTPSEQRYALKVRAAQLQKESERAHTKYRDLRTQAMRTALIAQTY